MKAQTPNKPGGQHFWQIWLDDLNDLVKCWDMSAGSENKYLSANQRRNMAGDTHGPDFFQLTRGEPEAREIMQKGWPEGAKHIDEIQKQITSKLPPPVSRRRKAKWGDYGDEYSTERAEHGLDPWRTSHRIVRRAIGLVELVCDWGGGCGGAERLIYNGAMIAALIDILERADYSVNAALIAGMHVPAPNNRDILYALLRMEVKQFGEAANPAKLSALTHPSAWRVYGLHALSLVDHIKVGDDYCSHPHVPLIEAHDFNGDGKYDAHLPDAFGLYGWRREVLTVLVPMPGSQKAAIEIGEKVIRQVTEYAEGVNGWHTSK